MSTINKHVSISYRGVTYGPPCIPFTLKYETPIYFSNSQPELIRQRIDKYAPSEKPIGRPNIGSDLTRLTARHCPSLIPSTDSAKMHRRSSVVYCYISRHEKKRSDTRYQCDVSIISLCVVGCFRRMSYFERFLTTFMS